jgi:protein gp37
MSETKISWTDETWNPIVGCSKISEGCQNCYAEKMAHRLACMGVDGYDRAVASGPNEFISQWSGTAAFVESRLDKPLKRKKPTTYFVCSMGDLFHESVPDEWIDKVFAVMARCPQHTFQVLTKRADRMLDYFHSPLGGIPWKANRDWYEPLPNVMLGVTAENQATADERIPILLCTPAAARFVSVEPMLGPVDVGRAASKIYNHPLGGMSGGPKIGWVICGCESGPKRRPMYLDWARDLQQQCETAGVPFFMKQLTKTKQGFAEYGFGSVTKDISDFPNSLQVREWPEMLKGVE